MLSGVFHTIHVWIAQSCRFRIFAGMITLGFLTPVIGIIIVATSSSVAALFVDPAFILQPTSTTSSRLYYKLSYSNSHSNSHPYSHSHLNSAWLLYSQQDINDEEDFKILPEKGTEGKDGNDDNEEDNNGVRKEDPKSIFPIELSIDGSILVVLPAVGIAVLGIITTAMVITNSNDDPILLTSSSSSSLAAAARIERLLSLDDKATNKVTDQAVKCRGICSPDKEEQLETIRRFMNSISTRNSINDNK